jgi:hypothetical protein
MKIQGYCLGKSFFSDKWCPLILPLLLCLQSFSQPFSTLPIFKQASQMSNLYKSKDYKGYIKYIVPGYVKAAGGEEKLIASFNALDAQLQAKGMAINKFDFTGPSEMIKNKGELQCTVTQQTEFLSAKGRVTTYTTLIAVSTDDGKTWKFMDTNSLDISAIRKLLPNLSPKIVLPPKQKPTVNPL